MFRKRYFLSFFLVFVIAFCASACKSSSEFGSKEMVSLLVPFYIYPTTINPQTGNLYWSDLAKSSSNITKISAIINPNNGDHGKYCDENFKKGVRQLKASGISVLGYTYTKYAHRDQALIEKSVDFYKDKYHVDAFFLDEANSSQRAMLYYEELRAYINKDASDSEIVLNYGVKPDEKVIKNDKMKSVVFEGEYKTFISDKNRIVSKLSQKNSVCFVYNVAREKMKDTIDLAIAKGCAQLYLTDDSGENPWDTLPSYWNAMLSYINKFNWL